MDEQTPGPMAWIKKNSTLLAVVVGAVLLGVMFLKKPSQASVVSATPVGDYSGLQKDANGNPIVYRDVADSYVTISDSYNTTTQQAPVVEQPIHDEIGIVRTRYNSNVTAGYDKQHSEGIPIRDSAGNTGKVIGNLAYGSTVNLTGKPVAGASNFAGTNNGAGSTTWVPVQGGYVSAYDLTGYY
jgi:hypothetical protein